MRIEDFAEKQTHYTGASNKVKWVITRPDILFDYFLACDYKPSVLKAKLNTSYATVKRFLCAAQLWDRARIKKQGGAKSGRKRTTIIDKFGYKYADSQYDYLNERGEIIRKYEHHVVAEQKIGRKLRNSELVHHIDGNKQNNHSNNLHVCENNSIHRLLHGSLEREAFKLVQQGIIKFHPDHGYYIDNEVLIES